MPTITVSKDAVKGRDVVPSGLYDVRLVAFRPKPTKAGDSVNLNGQFEIQNHPEYAGRMVFDNLSTNANAAWKLVAFVKAFGLDMTEAADGSLSIPGEFTGPENDATQWKYVGPLVGRTGKVEVAVDNYNGNDKNIIKTFVPAATVK